MKYCLYMDESGNHGLTLIQEDFPVFLLCGVLVSEEGYNQIRENINVIKAEFWDDKKVIFHSRDIRKCDKEFAILFDMEIKHRFYKRINALVAESDYAIIASAVRKYKYIEKYGSLKNDVYEISLSFIIERAVFFLDDIKVPDKKLEIIIERRGEKEDKKLKEHFEQLILTGTRYVTSHRLKKYEITISFRSKRENINGLQLVDLVAYPIARFVIEPNRANPAFDVCACKIYAKGGRMHGLKIFP